MSLTSGCFFRKYKSKHDLAGVTVKCGYSDDSRPEWLRPAQKDQLPQPAREAFPRPKPGDKPARAGPSLNRIKVAAAARGSVRNGIEVKVAPDDIFFRSTKTLVAQRNSLTNKVIKKIARRPTKPLKWKKLNELSKVPWNLIIIIKNPSLKNLIMNLKNTIELKKF